MVFAGDVSKDNIKENTITVGGINVTRAANHRANQELVRLATKPPAVQYLTECKDFAEACVNLVAEGDRFVTGTALSINGRELLA